MPSIEPSSSNTHFTADLTAECPICLEPLSRAVILLPCGHAFDIACVMQYFFVTQSDTQPKSCPLCRVVARIIELTDRSHEWISVATGCLVGHRGDDFDRCELLEAEGGSHAEARNEINGALVWLDQILADIVGEDPQFINEANTTAFLRARRSWVTRNRYVPEFTQISDELLVALENFTDAQTDHTTYEEQRENLAIFREQFSQWIGQLSRLLELHQEDQRNGG
jgi:hypothetical protein